jgi:hypothetical protein
MGSLRGEIIFVSVAAISLLGTLRGCDLLEDTTPHPWIGYAFNKNENRFEWEFDDWATARDCKEAMLMITETRPGWSGPVGCGYRGNNYWRAWIMNTFWGGDQIDCIIKKTSSEEARGGISYNVKLKGDSTRRGEGWYCV